MNITHATYIELPAPLAVVRDTLRHQGTWEALPLAAERLGTMWRAGRELYTIVFDDSAAGPNGAAPPAGPSAKPLTLRWEVVPIAAPDTSVQVEIALYDAVVATHARVRVSLLGHGDNGPLRRVFRRWLLARHVHACAETLQDIVRQRAYSAELVPQTQTVAAAVPVAAGAQAEDDTADTAGTADPIDARAQNGGAAPPARVAPTDAHSELAARLRRRYPATVEHFEAMGAYDHLERVWWLERNWERILRGEYNPGFYEQVPASSAAPAALDYDLIYAGGGLGLIHAVVMAQKYGWRVLLFDRSEVGCVHREWNISRIELQALVNMGFVSWDELASVIMRDYESGLVKFYAGPACDVPESELWFPDVLNVAVDAGGLLQLMRRKFEQAGGTILDRRSFRRVHVAEAAGQPPHVQVVLEAMDSGREETYRARLLLDGMGSTSPLALHRHAGKPFAGVCPTVGTIVSGLVPGTARDEFDPTIGDILISVDDAQTGRQMIWEGFPGRGDELTVYVFYYAALKNYGRSFEPPLHPFSYDHDDPQPRYSLLALFEQYFAMLPTYKKPGPDFRHVKPVYGYIPGRHSVDSQDSPLLRGVLPVGDSAAQQSPLTYCGFGSHVRNLHRTTSLLDHALRQGLLEPHHLRHISAFQVNVSLNWVFSRFMQPWGRPQDVNEIQNAFLAALNERGIDMATRFFRDRMRWHDYNQVVWHTMMRYKVVFLIAWPVLGVRGVWQWFCDYVRFSAAAAAAAAARAAGPAGERLLRGVADRLSPALGLRVRARYAEWRVMGWIDD